MGSSLISFHFNSFHMDPVFSRETIHVFCFSEFTDSCTIHTNYEWSLNGVPLRIIWSSSTAFIEEFLVLSVQSTPMKAVELL